MKREREIKKGEGKNEKLNRTRGRKNYDNKQIKGVFSGQALQRGGGTSRVLSKHEAEFISPVQIAGGEICAWGSAIPLQPSLDDGDGGLHPHAHTQVCP